MSLSLYFDHFTSAQPADAAPIVLLHGWGLHSQVWDSILPTLLQQRAVMVIDLPGMGRSPLPGGDYTLEYLVEHVVKIAPPRAIWMGWSLGGMVAASVAQQYPERIAALVTVATNPKFVASEDWPHAIALPVIEHFRALFAEDWQGTLVRFLALQCKDSVTMKDDIRHLKEIVFHQGLPATKALRCGLEILQQVDLRYLYRELTVPTLHVLGERDNLVPVAVQEGVKTLQPSARLAVIKDVAHLPFLSAPEVFMNAVTDFLHDCRHS